MGRLAAPHGELQLPRGRVDRIARHEAIGRVLAAHHAHEAGSAAPDLVLARDSRRVLTVAAGQRPQACVHAHDVGALQRPGEHLVDLVQEILDIRPIGRRVIEVEGPVRVRGADDPVLPPGKHEEHALLGGENERTGGLDAVPGDDEMDAFRGPHSHRAPDAGEALRLGRPDAGRVDDDASAHLELPVRLLIAQKGAGEALAAVEHGDDAHPRGADGPVLRRRARQGHDEACVVHLGIEVADAATQRVGTQRRHLAQARLPR